MPVWTRDKALMFMTTPLATDALIPTHLVAREKLSQTFTFDIQAVSQLGTIDPTQLLNNPVCVTVQDANGPVRYFHGIVRDVQSNGVVRGSTAIDTYESYSLTAVPCLWFLHQTRDCRIFENKTVNDILSAIFSDAGLTDVTISAPAGDPRPYTVQFNESNYNFVTRLMEEEGWYYFHQHTDSAHTLMVVNQNSSFTAIPNAAFHFSIQDVDTTGIVEWRAPTRTTYGSVETADYDPINPTTQLDSTARTILTTAGAATRAVYRWPALTTDASVVEARAKFEMEAAEASVSVFTGGSFFAALVPGGTFTVANNPAQPDDDTFAVLAVRHVIEDNTWMTSDGTASYRNQFEAFKTSVPWRQPLITPRPRMDGVHSAIVMGPQTDNGTVIGDIQMQDGVEIHTDDYARVRVRFFWDHRGESSGSLAMWARVVQPWAGNGWGTQFIPRVGTEVAVCFVDADPDRPIVMGGLYNGQSSPIYAVADKTKSGIRTRSSEGGSTSQFNELTFDDKSGSELIYMHAEKDLTTEVEHDQTLTVDNCRVVTIKVDETVQVQGKQTITVTKDHTFEVTQGNYARTIDQGNSTFTVSQGNDTTTISQGNSELAVSLGNIKIHADTGAIDINATQSITLTVGGSSIKIEPAGITMSTVQLKMSGSAMVTVDGAMTKVSGDGMLTLVGALAKIN